MSLKERISEEMKAAMKSGDKTRLGVVRMLHAAIRKKEIDEKITLVDADVIKVVSALVKQRQDSIEQFQKAQRQDLVDKETEEMTYLQSLLPKQMDQAEIVKIIEATIQEAGATSKKEMGQVMKLLMPKVAGKADGKLVNQLVNERLK